MQITINIAPDMLERIDNAARGMGLSRSAWLRFRACGGTAEALPPATAMTIPTSPVLFDVGGKPEKPWVEVEPYRSTRGTADAPPAGYVLVTIEERDVGKDGWMSPADAGV